VIFAAGGTLWITSSSSSSGASSPAPIFSAGFPSGSVEPKTTLSRRNVDALDLTDLQGLVSPQWAGLSNFFFPYQDRPLEVINAGKNEESCYGRVYRYSRPPFSRSFDVFQYRDQEKQDRDKHASPALKLRGPETARRVFLRSVSGIGLAGHRLVAAVNDQATGIEGEDRLTGIDLPERGADGFGGVKKPKQRG